MDAVRKERAEGGICRQRDCGPFLGGSAIWGSLKIEPSRWVVSCWLSLTLQKGSGYPEEQTHPVQVLERSIADGPYRSPRTPSNQFAGPSVVREIGMT